MDAEQQDWGVRINRSYYDRQVIPKLCEEWVTWQDKDEWDKNGVVVWSHQAQRIECLSAAQALQYLEQMRTNDNWQTEGIPILRQSTVIKLEDTRKKKDKHKTGEEEDPSAEETPSKGETVVEERFRLSPDQSVEFFKLLELNERMLQTMADEDEQKRSKALWEAYSFILQRGKALKAEKFDWETRSFQWKKDPVNNNWVCDHPPNRGSIFSTDDHLFWEGCLERPGQFKHRSRPFSKLEDVVIWVEQQLEAAEKEAIEPKEDEYQKISLDELIAQKRETLADYWIDPAAVDSERITYQAIIVLDCAPYDYKTMEISFGEKHRYDEKFVSATQLASQLQLDPQLDIEHLVSGLFMITSRVTYLQRDIAMSQAQRFWDQSVIVQQHRAGKVTYAEYGIKEVETGYNIILGICEDPNRPYSAPQSREEHLARKAFIVTLEYALDVDGYRAYLEFQSSRITDEMLLEMMHRHRAKSSLIPIEVQLESERWLRENNVK